MSNVRVRFAPSPTGEVHIGNIRVAIFNWLFARHHNGEFLLRVEDTDRERSTPEAVDAVLHALDWLGMTPDESPVYQSERRDAHLEAAERLLAAGLAYREDVGNTGRGECVVFRMPGDVIEFCDAVRGDLKKAPEDMKDLVIVRSDGSPVFHLGNVVDDIHMGVTHVIRGDDHIENTFRHIALYRALGSEPPRFVHLPMIVNAQGKPYSKRDGAAFVGEFRDQGFLSEALFNYLALLGWSPGDDREVMPRDEMTAAFTVERIQSSPARMDLAKLEWMNGEYIRALPAETFVTAFTSALKADGLPMDEYSDDVVSAVAGMMQERTKRFTEVPADAGFFFTEDFAFDGKAVRKRLMKDGVADLLGEMVERLGKLDPFEEPGIEACVRQFAEETERSVGNVVHPLRVAASGLSKGPGLFEMLAALGRGRVVARLKRAVEMIERGESV